ncbi:DNA alkylation repair protein [Subtercola sp. YIM 133946]|uniref:DNA alkylation repair protein n=1 Tax=Subtercola sp. YIM 133946 TaxID=3118909 RepID=UPI002F95D334
MPTADELLGVDVLARMIGVLERVLPGHPLAALRASAGELAPLALRQRSDLLKDALLADLPGTAAELDEIVRAALTDARFTGWMIWPVSEAVTARALEGGGRGVGVGPGAGVNVEADTDADARFVADFDAALALLAELTPRLTGEFAIRPLLQADLGRALPIILTWTTNPDPHVRRLASEGTRAFLPWAKRVPALLAEPRATLPIIDALYRDESEYVRRSVANHLNDLSRQSPDLAAAVAGEWMLAADSNTAQVVRHGLRSLVKKGHGPTLALFGYAVEHGVTVTGPTLSGPPLSSDASRAAGLVEVAVGGELPFTVTLENTADAPATLVIDYVVHHRKANGSQTAKVFKLATTTLRPGQTLTYTRRHSFKRITTRVYHPGEHAIEVQVNGVPSGRTPFLLVAD